jgi:subtilase family serine protease
MARKVGNSRISAENAATGDANRSGGAGLRFAASAATATLTAFSVVAALAGTADAATATSDLSANLAPQHIGTAPAIPAGAVRTGATAADTTLHLAVNLKPRDPAALSAFVAGVSDKNSPLYHHYLAAGQFAQAFGPAQSTRA